MRLRFTYKDPDFSVFDVEKRKDVTLLKLANETEESIHRVGLGGEYVTIEVDTVTGHTRVVP